VAVVAFADEEGGRFNLPTFGSRLLAGQLDPGEVLDRRDADGVRLADALAAAGLDPRRLGPDPDRLANLTALVELHVEQGRALADRGAALAVASGIWPHGRWRLTANGEPNHAGTTRMADRHDPAAVLAVAIDQAREQAVATGAVATVGRILVEPNGTNSIPARVTAWLDARAPDDAALDGLVGGWWAAVGAAAGEHGVAVELGVESRTPAVTFDPALRHRLRDGLAAHGLDAVELPTAAGHDAGTLAAAVPTGMLFVRNPTGVSHSPAEHAEEADCLTGVLALAAVLEDLACRP
jgi:beta-ureidopropionase / N-carbamoyl-L-amino-acid hydrolase